MNFDLKASVKKLILKSIPPKIFNFFFFNHPEYKKLTGGFISFSQEGEDMILRRLFQNKQNGFYVDVGAHHPINYSNTNYFNQRGWRGINIDGLPGNKTTFDKLRPNDINLEMLVAENEGTAEFYLFNPSLMNTMSKSQMIENQKFAWCTLLGSVTVPCMPLSKVFSRYVEPGIKIDFMTIDVEGAEMSVLKSNDWDKYRPDVLLVEFIDMAIEDIFKSDIHNYLSERAYNFSAKTGNTVFYKKHDFFAFS